MMQNSVVEVLKNVPHGIDGSTFFAPTIPSEVKTAVPLMYNMEDKVFENLLGAILFSMKRGKIPCEKSILMGVHRVYEEPKISAIFTALYMIMKTAVRHRTKVSVVEKDLTEINVPKRVVALIVKLMRQERLDLESQSILTRVRFPRLDNLQWRVDVAISSSSLLRIFRPSILVQIALSDGRMRTFDVTVEQFHKLRYNVAKALRDMQELERHPIMRIAFESDKKKFDDK